MRRQRNEGYRWGGDVVVSKKVDKVSGSERAKMAPTEKEGVKVR
jgi:hypothetical protein